MRLNYRFILTAVFMALSLAFVMGAGLVAVTQRAHAQYNDQDFSREVSYFRLYGAYNAKYRAPVDADLEAYTRAFKGPKAPIIPQVEFYEYEAPPHLQGRVERLVHGITIDLPNEYDYYGYEMRRYMRVIGRMSIFENRYDMEDELVNIEKASVIFRYWRQDLLAEIESIEKAIAADPSISSKVKTKFQVNKAIVNAFIVEAKSWLFSNEEFLKFMSDNRKFYSFEGGYFLFRTQGHKNKFLRIYRAREVSLHRLQKNYGPFGDMVY